MPASIGPTHLVTLIKYMEEKQSYLDGKLTLAQIAENLEISTNHLSQVINENLNQNFFDFINAYRVDLVKEKMADSANNHLTLLGIARSFLNTLLFLVIYNGKNHAENHSKTI